MAVMDTTNRFRTFAQFMRDQACTGLLKADIQAAVNAADDWADTNSAAFNAALPVPFRTTASTALKGLLLCYVVMRRNGLLRAKED